MNIYLKDIADEFSYRERSSQGLLRSRHQQSTADRRIRHNENKMSSDNKSIKKVEQVRASRKQLKSGKVMTSISNPTSSWVSDPEEQWEWLHRVMDEARRKDQNVSYI